MHTDGRAHRYRRQDKGALHLCTSWLYRQPRSPQALLGWPLFCAGESGRSEEQRDALPKTQRQQMSYAEPPQPQPPQAQTDGLRWKATPSRPLMQALRHNDPALESPSLSLFSKSYPTAEFIIPLQVTDTLPTVLPSPHTRTRSFELSEAAHTR